MELNRAKILSIQLPGYRVNAQNSYMSRLMPHACPSIQTPSQTHAPCRKSCNVIVIAVARSHLACLVIIFEADSKLAKLACSPTVIASDNSKLQEHFARTMTFSHMHKHMLHRLLANNTLRRHMVHHFKHTNRQLVRE